MGGEIVAQFVSHNVLEAAGLLASHPASLPASRPSAEQTISILAIDLHIEPADQQHGTAIDQVDSNVINYSYRIWPARQTAEQPASPTMHPPICHPPRGRLRLVGLRLASALVALPHRQAECKTSRGLRWGDVSGETYGLAPLWLLWGRKGHGRAPLWKSIVPLH